jgi:hypothetical protein
MHCSRKLLIFSALNSHLPWQALDLQEQVPSTSARLTDTAPNREDQTPNRFSKASVTSDISIYHTSFCVPQTPRLPASPPRITPSLVARPYIASTLRFSFRAITIFVFSRVSVLSMRSQQVFAEYGIDWSLHSGYEVDHIVSLELGGSNDISNLFPESYSIQYGARTKDKLEDNLHEQVCTHRLPLAVAQDEIATDWLKYYLAAQDNTDPMPPLRTGEADAVSAISASSFAGRYYTSSYSTAKYFYPGSCNAWKSLSPSYLVGFGSLEALLARYPNFAAAVARSGRFT